MQLSLQVGLRSMLNFPKKAGFYEVDEEAGLYKKHKLFKACPFADSEQISANKYKLQHDLYFRAKDGRIFIVKKGFIHDGASKGFLKSFGKYTNAAILHDALYGSGHDRSEADSLFDEAMEISGVSWLRRNTYWAFVRVGGWYAYNTQDEKEIEENKKFIIIGVKKDG